MGGRTLNVSFILRHPRTNDAYKKGGGMGRGRVGRRRRLKRGWCVQRVDGRIDDSRRGTRRMPGMSRGEEQVVRRLGEEEKQRVMMAIHDA